MSPGLTVLRRLLIFVHRWVGVALSVLFMLWFGSGIVMMYWSFPSVTAQDRLQRAPVLNPAQITMSAAEAFARIGYPELPSYVLLTSFDGRPLYVGDEGEAVVYADDGTVPRGVDEGVIDRAAAAWSGRPLREASKEPIEEVDQWTVGGDLRAIRPMFKYSWPDGQHVYVNGRTAEVVQYTTTASRLWAYLGAIPHWFYFTPVRNHPRQWFSLVVWSSLIGSASALLGVVIAIWMYSPGRRYRHNGRPASIPYRGWKRWHTVIGLVFGVIATTWAFSGMLSMGPFPIVDRLAALAVGSNPPPAQQPAGGNVEGGSVEAGIALALRGGRLPSASYADKGPAAAIASVAGFEVKELEYASFAGQALYLVANGRGETRIIPVRGTPRAAFDADDMIRRLRSATGGTLAELRLMEEYDAYYLDRRRIRPLPVIYARVNDAVGSRYYIDPRTATIVATYSARDWVTRWLYHALHSFDFPWLSNHRPLWDIVVITLMLGGTALCATSLVLTWRVLTRRVRAIWRRGPGAEDDEYTVA